MLNVQDDHFEVPSGEPVRAGHSSLPAWRPVAGAVAVIAASTALASIDLQGGALDPGTYPWQTSNNYTFATHPGYCGAAFCDEINMRAGMGGGHASFCVPDAWLWAMEALQHSWAGDPLPSDGLSGAGANIGSSDLALARASVSSYGDRFDSDEWHNLGGGSWPPGFAQPGVIQPEPAHSYYGDVYVPGGPFGNTRGAILKCYPGSGRQAECLVPTRHILDLDTRRWGLTTNFRSNPSAAAGASIFFRGINRAFSCTNTSGGVDRSVLDMWTPDGARNGVWTTVPISNSIRLWLYSGGFIAHVRSGLLIWCPPATSQAGLAAQTYVGATQHQFWAIDAAALAAGLNPAAVQLNVNNPGGTWPVKQPAGYGGACGSTGWAYCPENGSSYAIDGEHLSTSLWDLQEPSGCSTPAEYQAATWNLVEHALSSGIPCGSTGSAMGGTNEPMNRLAWSTFARCLTWDDWFVGNKPVAITPPGF